MIINSKKWDTSLSTQIVHYNYNKGLSKQPVSFKNCIVRFKTLVLTSKVSSSEPNSSKDVMVEPFIFLNSTLISKFYWGNSIDRQEQNCGNTRGSDQSFQFQYRKNT